MLDQGDFHGFGEQNATQYLMARGFVESSVKLREMILHIIVLMDSMNCLALELQPPLFLDYSG